MENAVRVVLSFSFLANFPQVVNKLITEDNLDLFSNLSTAFYFMHKLNNVEKKIIGFLININQHFCSCNIVTFQTSRLKNEIKIISMDYHKKVLKIS